MNGHGVQGRLMPRTPDLELLTQWVGFRSGWVDTMPTTARGDREQTHGNEEATRPAMDLRHAPPNEQV